MFFDFLRLHGVVWCGDHSINKFCEKHHIFLFLQSFGSVHPDPFTSAGNVDSSLNSVLYLHLCRSTGTQMDSSAEIEIYGVVHKTKLYS
jgi:hypothetical protein